MRRRQGPAARTPLSWPALFLLAVLAATIALRAPGQPRPSEPAKSEPAGRPAVRTLDDLKKLPPGAVVVICEDAREGLKLVPRGILLAPEEHQKLLAEIEQLRALAGSEKPAPPSACQLSGQVEGGVIRLKAVFALRTERANALVALGCPQGKPTAAALDDRLPVLRATEDGFVLQVDKPGDHQLTLEMEVALTARGGDLGFDLDLPQAAITSLALDLPEAVREVRLSTQLSSRDARSGPQVVPTVAAPGKPSRLESRALGPVSRVQAAWKGPDPLPTSGLLLTADVQVAVRADDAWIVTEAEFILTTKRGEKGGQGPSQWQLLVPPQARLIRPRLPDERIAAVEAPEPKNPGLRVVRLKASSVEPVRLAFQVQQPRPAAGTAVPVGPFLVLRAFQQQGTILISALPELRVTARPRVDPQVLVTPREITDRERREEPPVVAAFNFYHLPGTPRAGTELLTGPVYLNLDFETLRGGISTYTTHTLRLAERAWRLTTRIDVNPLRTGGVDSVPLYLPPGYELRSEEEVGQRVDVAEAPGPGAGRMAQVLLTPRRTGPFQITLEGVYLPLLDPETLQKGSTTLDLPQPRRTIDRGGQVTVHTGAGVELVPPRGPDPVWEGLSPGKSEYTWQTRRAPESAQVAWQPYRPEVVVESEANVTLTGHQGQVRQLFRFREAAFSSVTLWVPESVGLDRVRLAGRGKIAPLDEAQGLPRKVGLRPLLVTPAPGAERETSLAVDYSFDLPAEDRAGMFALPLLWPEQATRTEMKVRIWGPPGVLPIPAGGPGSPWEVQMDRGDGRSALPALVLRGTRPDQPPMLRLADASALPPAFVERVLVRAQVHESGMQAYRVWFVLGELHGRALELDMPAPLASINLKTILWALPVEGTTPITGAQVLWAPVEDAGQRARLNIASAWGRAPAVLEVVYQLPPGRSGLVQTVLTPPQLHSPPPSPGGRAAEVPIGEVRWEVALPAGWVPLYREGSLAPEFQWGWRGWLLAPRPNRDSADLDAWALTGLESSLARAITDGSPPRPPASIVCWRGGLEAIRIHHAPQQAWLLLCSVGILAVGFGLYWLAPPNRLFWPLVSALAVALGATALFAPAVLAAVVYGCQPGALVLVLVLGAQWLLQQRYQRQLVFMPGFSRSRAGSSIIRPTSGSQRRPPGEPSTVDAEPPSA